MNNRLFVTAAFALTWLVLLGYLFYVHRALRRARTLLDRATQGGPR